jgi:hypothetical protein
VAVHTFQFLNAKFEMRTVLNAVRIYRFAFRIALGL